jgi:hypothetical protein
MIGSRMRKVGELEVSEAAFFAGTLVCPSCGDTKFGSASKPDGTLIRHCHGNINDETSCQFQWPSSDDHKYFYLPLEFVHARIVDI